MEKTYYLGVYSVTIITPTTHDREAFNKRITAIGQNQDYPNVIEHLFDYENYTIGSKLNRLCNEAKGDIIVRFDSDDQYTPNYISNAVTELISSKAECTGLRDIYYYDGYYMRKYTAMRAINGKPTQVVLCGATLVFWRKAWDKCKFYYKPTGEDSNFCANVGRIHPSPHINDFLATLHGSNISSGSNLHAPEFSFVDNLEATKILSNF